jgi:hypothetical protein
MPVAATLSALISRLRGPKQAGKKPGWGKHSHIDMLADSLVRDREGWVLGNNAIHRNGIDIAWTGPLTAAGTSVTVKMDGQRFPVTADETRKLKVRLNEFLAGKIPNKRESGEQ